MTQSRSLSTRRGFIAAAGFSVLGLYGAWAYYGAAPLSFFGSGNNTEGGGHAGHGGGGESLSPEEFERLTEEFITTYRRDDGMVQPFATMPEMSDMPENDMSQHDMTQHDMTQHDMAQQDEPPPAEDHAEDHAAHTAPAEDTHGQQSDTEDAHVQHGDTEDTAQTAIDVYLMARKWNYAPDHLQLAAGQPYRFRMMAMDAAHGATIHLGKAARVIRLPKHTLVETTLTFAKPGIYPVYCTVYCGAGHDRMAGRIVVA